MSHHAKLAKAYLDQLCDRIDRGDRITRPKAWWKAALPVAVGASLGVAACGGSDTGDQTGNVEQAINCDFLPDEPISPTPLYAAPAPPATEIDCFNGVDDDGDTFEDCADPDCALACSPVALYAAPAPTLNEDCDNLTDDDLDGDVDCADTDCAGEPYCNATALYAAPGPEPEPAEICGNCLDDDGDGRFDCADLDCADYPGCETAFEHDCANGVDDDADGLADCADDDCALECGAQPLYAAPAPPPGSDEICEGGEDEDLDGAIDCADPDCADDPACETGAY